MAYQAIPPSSAGSTVGPSGAWPSAQKTLMLSLVPELTAFQYIKPEQSLGAAVPSTSDGANEGGGRGTANATFSFIGPSIFQTPKTGKWAFAFRAKFLAASAGQSNAVGLANVNASHDVLIGAVASISTANYGLSLDGAVSTTDDTGVANDLGWHTFVVAGNATNVRVYIDGALRATRTITTNLVDEATYPIVYNTLTTETVWSEFLYGYIAP